MSSLLFWIISVALGSFYNTYYKKAVVESENLSVPLFKLFANIFWLIVVIWLFIYFWFDFALLLNPLHISIITLILFSALIRDFNKWYILKNAKLSQLLPYDNLDKIFIVVM